MKPEKPTEESTDAADLRRRAQARLQSQTPPPKVRGSTEELQRLVQELQVHQIELEMQNEALEESHARLEASAARYTDLYDFAPVSYFTLGIHGKIIQSNLAGARMLGLDRSRLLDHRFDAFVASADLPAFRTLLTRAFATQSPETIELRLAINDKSPVAVLLQACVSEDGRESRLVLTDITERKRAECQIEERRKGLQAVFGLAVLAVKTGITLDEIYQSFVNLLPASWQYPEVTCARIIMGDSDFRTRNFKPSAWMQSVPVRVNGAVVGRIEVGYLEERSEDDGPFYKEEKDLIEALATQLGILTERKQAEVALRASEEKHRLLFENAGDLIFINNEEGQILDANPMAVKLLGYTRPELMSMTIQQIDSLEDRLDTADRIARLIQEGHLTFQTALQRKDGSLIQIDVNARRIVWDGKPAFLSICRDITERREIERALQASLAEKTVLLREIHHRVKNNLQIIISLLNLQSGQSQKGDMLDILANTRNRVRSMALIHENLYRSENLAYLNLTNYLEDLCANLLRSAGPVRAGVRIESQVENKSISIGLNQAVPFGLLINELVTNALKHAFPGERTGIIRVTIQSPAREKVLLTVTDDGVGLPAALDPHHTESLGLQLVYLLTDQLHGTVNFERGQGTTVQILFPNLAKAGSL